MIKKLIAGWILCFAGAEALLPPLYESIREYKSLLEDSELSNRLDSADSIQSIERQEDRFFIKTSTGKRLEVQVVFDAQEMPGPAKFHFKFIDKEEEVLEYPHWRAMVIPANSSRSYKCCKGSHFLITFINNYSFPITLWGRQDEGVRLFKVWTSHGWGRDQEIPHGPQTIVIQYE